MVIEAGSRIEKYFWTSSFPSLSVSISISETGIDEWRERPDHIIADRWESGMNPYSAESKANSASIRFHRVAFTEGLC